MTGQFLTRYWRPFLNKKRRNAASAVVAALLTVTVLSILAGSLAFNVVNSKDALNQENAWQEALVVAEAGAHQGLAQLQGALPLSTPIPIANLDISPVPALSAITAPVPHTGDGSTSGTASYTLAKKNVVYPANSGSTRTLYRIYSTGSVNLPGGRQLSANSQDTVLRKLNMKSHTASNRNASRSVEVWISPVYNTDFGLLSVGPISLNNHQILVDSFISTNTPPLSPLSQIRAASYTAVANNTTTPGYFWTHGQPGTAGQFNHMLISGSSPPTYNDYVTANLGTDQPLVGASGATVWGDLLTNGGTPGVDQTGLTGIKGHIYNDFYQSIAPVVAPVLTSPTALGSVSNTVTLNGGTAAAHGAYTATQVTVGGGKILHCSLGKTNGVADPAKNYVDLYDSGSFTTSGSGYLSIDAGVLVRLWVGGNTTISGSGLVNGNGTATFYDANTGQFVPTLQFFAINPPVGTAQTITISGAAAFFGAFYAPGADMTLSGGGSLTGSFVVGTLHCSGDTTIHYDESLRNGGVPIRLNIVSWFEDTSKDSKLAGNSGSTTH